jgi:hypothetical protein
MTQHTTDPASREIAALQREGFAAEPPASGTRLADVLVVTGDIEADPDRETFALQRLIDAGQWRLEGSIGRAMMDAIEAGRCTLGPKPAWDYWGNRIPSKHEVQPGTKGSEEFVAAHR